MEVTEFLKVRYWLNNLSSDCLVARSWILSRFLINLVTSRSTQGWEFVLALNCFMGACLSQTEINKSLNLSYRTDIGIKLSRGNIEMLTVNQAESYLHQISNKTYN